VLLASLLGALVWLSSASPAVAELDFDEAVDLAASNAGAAEGGAYASGAAARLGRDVESAVRKCLEADSGEVPPILRIVVRLDASGAVERVWQSTTTGGEGCVSRVVEARSVDPPPFAPFYLLLELRS
jgi:hypothetical protein